MRQLEIYIAVASVNAESMPTAIKKRLDGIVDDERNDNGEYYQHNNVIFSTPNNIC